MSSICFHNQSSEINRLWFESHKTLIMNLCIEFDCVDRLEELTNKYLGNPIKLKKLKDPAKPKRTRSAFFYYCHEYRPLLMEKVRQRGEKVNIGNISKDLGQMWSKLKNREKYINLNQKDKVRYQEAMDVYKN